MARALAGAGRWISSQRRFPVDCEHQEDDRRGGRPDNLQCVASVTVESLVTGTLPISDQEINVGSLSQHEDHRRQPEDHHEQSVDLLAVNGDTGCKAPDVARTLFREGRNSREQGTGHADPSGKTACDTAGIAEGKAGRHGVVTSSGRPGILKRAASPSAGLASRIGLVLVLAADACHEGRVDCRSIVAPIRANVGEDRRNLVVGELLPLRHCSIVSGTLGSH